MQGGPARASEFNNHTHQHHYAREGGPFHYHYRRLRDGKGRPMTVTLTCGVFCPSTWRDIPVKCHRARPGKGGTYSVTILGYESCTGTVRTHNTVDVSTWFRGVSRGAYC